MTRTDVFLCALPGCDVVLEPRPGQPPRRFCSAAHRAMAGRAEYSTCAPAAAEAPRCALPGCDEPVRVVPGQEPREFCSATHRAKAKQARPAETEPTQCALPECGGPIEVVPGQPVRRYCCAAHRAKARQVRSRSAAADQSVPNVTAVATPDAAGQSGPGVNGSVPAAPGRDADATVAPDEAGPATGPDAADASADDASTPAAAGPTAGSVAHDRTPGRASAGRHPRTRPPAEPTGGESRRGPARGDRVPHLRRLVVVAVAAAVLAGGVWAAAQEPGGGPAADTDQAALQFTTVDPTQWTTTASLTLTSIERQLDQLAVAEAAWNAQPRPRRAAVPAAVQTLLDRKATLDIARTVLLHQLESVRAVDIASTDLTSAQRELDDLERLASALPPPTSDAESGAHEQLVRQRDIALQMRDSRQRTLDELRRGAAAVTAAPLLDPTDTTSAVTEAVLVLTREPPPPPAPDVEQPPTVLAARDDDTEHRGGPGTSAPPDPRGPDDKIIDEPEPPKNRPVRASSALGETVEGVTGALTGRPDRDPAPSRSSSDRHDDDGDRDDKAPVTAPVRKVVEVADGVTAPILGGSDGDDRRSADEPAEPAPKPERPERDDEPRVEMPRVELPRLPVPEIAIPRLRDDIADAIRDAVDDVPRTPDRPLPSDRDESNGTDDRGSDDGPDDRSTNSPKRGADEQTGKGTDKGTDKGGAEGGADEGTDDRASGTDEPDDSQPDDFGSDQETGSGSAEDSSGTDRLLTGASSSPAGESP